MLDCPPKPKNRLPELACLVVEPKENPLGVPPNPVVWPEVFKFPNNELRCMWDGPPKCPVPELTCFAIWSHQKKTHLVFD